MSFFESRDFMLIMFGSIIMGFVGFAIWLLYFRLPQIDEEERQWKLEKKERKRLKKLAKQHAQRHAQTPQLES